MCYSKEVQLGTALVIFASSAFYYAFFSKKYSYLKGKWLQTFLNNVMLVFFCIGTHQFFEFLSLVTGNQIIYKTGWIFSVSSMYFGIRALEVLSNKDFRSWTAIPAIFVFSALMFFRYMPFEEFSFYLRHYNVGIITTLWVILFVYAHLCAFITWKSLKDKKSKRTLILFMFAIGDISIILALAYYILGSIFFSVSWCYDFPSIWCTFYVIQSLFIPFFLYFLNSIYRRPKKKIVLPWKLFFLFVGIGIIFIFIFLLRDQAASCIVSNLAFA